jgi:hypothetical protein
MPFKLVIRSQVPISLLFANSTIRHEERFVGGMRCKALAALPQKS